MKRTTITLVGVVILVLLIVRMFFVMVNRSNDTRRTFVSKLNYDLSAQVDSVGLFNKPAPVGFLYIKLTRGTFDNNEKKIARSLNKQSGKLRFLVPFKGDRFEIFNRDAIDFRVGDSLLINSAVDKLVVFRASKKVKEYTISDDLRGGED